MSLSSVLSDKDSPLGRFLTAELPGVALVRAGYRARLPVGLDVVLPKPPEGRRPDWGVIGAAIDLRLRCALSDVPPTGGAVAAGVRLIGGPRMSCPAPVRSALQGAGSELLREVERTVVECRPFDRSRSVVLGDRDEQRLGRLCVVAAWFEVIYRTGRLWAGTPLGDAGAHTTLDSLVSEVPPYIAADLDEMVERASAGLADVRSGCSPSEVRIGPTFAGSGDVGGADADWIAGDLLVDVKSTARVDRLTAEDVYQLACYALLDYDDVHGIDRVGWYLARLGRLVTWDIDEFFALLGATYSLGDLRHLVATMLSCPTSRS